MKSASGVGSNFAMGAIAFGGGCAIIAIDAISWYIRQFSLLYGVAQVSLGLILGFFSVETLGLFAVILGAFLMYKGVAGWKTGGQPGTVRALLADSVASHRDLRIGILAGLAYGFVYLFVSGTLVFQPLVDFATAYGVSGSALSSAVCCGAPGATPTVVGYQAQSHLGVQLVPFNLFLAVVVPILVGFNTSVAVHSLRYRPVRGNFGLVGSFGALVGLFTGCPTCAALSLASAAGGIGASTLALALAPYQILFVVVSIPVLVVSPLIMASNANRAMLASCPV